MARGINKVIIVGNLGQDPDTRYTQSGAAITTISVATSEQWTDKEGEKQERTEWHRIKFFGRLAEIAGEYLAKGRQVYIEGKLQTDKYTDKEGIERYATNIIAFELQMLGGNPGGSRGEDHGGEQRTQQSQKKGGSDQGDSPRERAKQASAAGQQSRPPLPEQAGFDDDDIPF